MHHWTLIGLACGTLMAVPGAARAEQSDIIVTGEKRVLPLGQTTSSVSVFSADDIETAGSHRVQQLYERTANLAPTYGRAGFSIRGISNVGVSNAGEASTATVYVDGAPLAATFLHAAPTDLWDVSRVEILRGPQSTLQGLNALAGVIMIRTSEPSLTVPELRTRLRVTDEWLMHEALAFSLPLVTNQLALRLSAERLDRDGFIRNITLNRGEDREEHASIRARLLWVPAALPGFSGRLSYTRFRRFGGGYGVYARTDTPRFFDNPVATNDAPNTTRLALDGVSGELRYALNNQLTLSSIAGWSLAKEDNRYDGDYGPIDASFGSQRRRYRTWTHELRLNLEGDALSGLLGFFYYDRTLDSRTTSRTDVPTPVSTIAGLLAAGGANPGQASAIAAAYGRALPAVRVDFSGSFPTDVRSIALFADGRYRLTARLSLLAGLRFDRETNIAGVTQRSLFAGVYPDPVQFGLLGPAFAQINAAVGSFVAQSNTRTQPVERRFESFIPKAGLLMRWNDHLTTGLVVQRGYRSGGSSTNIARGATIAYDPEYTLNSELSVRMRSADGKLRVDANAFHTRWRQQQVAVNFGLNAFDVNTVNAGKSYLYGLEIEGAFSPTMGLAFRGQAGMVKTKFEQFRIVETGAVSNLSGSQFAFAPRWTMSGGVDYRAASGWSAGLDFRYASSAFGNVGVNQASYPVDARTTVNARLALSREPLTVRIEATNLFDASYIQYKSPAESRAIIGDPRTIGLVVDARF